MSLFSSTIFNSSVFNTGGVTPPTPTPTPGPVLTEGGIGGLASPRYSSLSKTALMPGMRQLIEADDEIILKAIMLAVTSETLH